MSSYPENHQWNTLMWGQQFDSWEEPRIIERTDMVNPEEKKASLPPGYVVCSHPIHPGNVLMRPQKWDISGLTIQ